MIDSRKIENLVIEFDVALIKAKNSGTITEAAKWSKVARNCITELGKAIREMKQEELDLTQDIYNRLKPGEKPYVKAIKL